MVPWSVLACLYRDISKTQKTSICGTGLIVLKLKHNSKLIEHYYHCRHKDCFVPYVSYFFFSGCQFGELKVNILLKTQRDEIPAKQCKADTGTYPA